MPFQSSLDRGARPSVPLPGMIALLHRQSVVLLKSLPTTIERTKERELYLFCYVRRLHRHLWFIPSTTDAGIQHLLCVERLTSGIDRPSEYYSEYRLQ